MLDSVQLKVDGKIIEDFVEYEMEADLYVADDAFTLKLADTDLDIKKGSKCELHVNNQLEHTGIIEKIKDHYTKDGSDVELTGRDLMGILAEAYCEEFPTHQNITLKELTEKLIKKLPFINRKDITYQGNAAAARNQVGSSLHSGKLQQDPFKVPGSEPHKFVQINPGDRVFDVLKEFALSRGVVFYSLPQGTFVFGKPKTGGTPLYSLISRQTDPQENNVEEGTKVEDICKAYSKITVIGQQPAGQDPFVVAKQINTKAVVENPGFPFYKPYVHKNCNDGISPQKQAEHILNKMRAGEFQLIYKVPGHSQNGRNWMINEMCQVLDERLKINDSFLIYNRRFTLSKEGSFTILTLGRPGLIL